MIKYYKNLIYFLVIIIENDLNEMKFNLYKAILNVNYKILKGLDLENLENKLSLMVLIQGMKNLFFIIIDCHNDAIK